MRWRVYQENNINQHNLFAVGHVAQLGVEDWTWGTPSRVALHGFHWGCCYMAYKITFRGGPGLQCRLQHSGMMLMNACNHVLSSLQIKGRAYCLGPRSGEKRPIAGRVGNSLLKLTISREERGKCLFCQKKNKGKFIWIKKAPPFILGWKPFKFDKTHDVLLIHFTIIIIVLMTVWECPHFGLFLSTQPTVNPQWGFSERKLKSNHIPHEYLRDLRQSSSLFGLENTVSNGTKLSKTVAGAFYQSHIKCQNLPP